MKKQLLFLVLIVAWGRINAQEIKDLSSFIGKWEGKLTYVDYSSGKPFTMSANINIGLTNDKKGYIMGYEYPKEPHANSKDTLYVENTLFGKERIVDFKKDAESGFRLVTEKVGNDGNDNKKAVLRHIYLLKSNTFSITKEVKFEGTDIWIKRNEYGWKRVGN